MFYGLNESGVEHPACRMIRADFGVWKNLIDVDQCQRAVDTLVDILAGDIVMAHLVVRPAMKIAGTIVAGGSASRIGGVDKPLLPIRKAPIVDFLLQRLSPQVDAISVNVRATSRQLYANWEKRGVTILFDPFVGRIGPLGGVIAGLTWLSTLGDDFEWLATMPGDTPFLPETLVTKLTGSARERRDQRPVVALDGDRVQSLCAIWPKRCLPELLQCVVEGRLRSVRSALNALGCTEQRIDTHHGFFNINTLEDLAEAERLADQIGCGVELPI